MTDDIRRVVFTSTEWWIADHDSSDAELILSVSDENGKGTYEPDICDVADAFTSVKRTAPLSYPVEADLTVEPLDNVVFGGGHGAIDATKPESYYWSARKAVMDARHILTCGRYREGNCREMDEVNSSLGRIEEELRLLALAVDKSRKRTA